MSVKRIIGFETGGLEAFGIISGSPSVVTSPVRTGTYALRFSGSDYARLTETTLVGSVLNDYIIGFAWRTDTIPPASASRIFSVYDTSAIVYAIEITTGGEMRVAYNNGGGIINTGFYPNANTWYFLELGFIISDTVGEVRLWVDGTVYGTASSVDTQPGSFPTYMMFGLAGNPTGENHYIDDVYFITEGTLATDRWGDCRIKGYRSNLVSATPDSGTALTSGTWANMQEVPWSDTNSGAYDTSSAVGGYAICNDVGGSAGTGGPNTDNDLVGATMKCAQWQLRGYRGGGSPTSHYLRIGNNSSQTDSADLLLSTSAANFLVVSENPTYIPTTSQYIINGMAKSSGARGLFCHELFATVAYIPPPPTYAPPPFNPAYLYMPHLAR